MLLFEPDAPPGPTEAAVLPEADAPPPPDKKETAMFDVEVEAEIIKNPTVSGSDFSQVMTLGWSFLLEAPAANF